MTYYFLYATRPLVRRIYLKGIIHLQKTKKYSLSYELAVIRWITSCNKNRMTTREITLWLVHVTSLTTFMSTLRFLVEIITLKAIKSH